MSHPPTVAELADRGPGGGRREPPRTAEIHALRARRPLDDSEATRARAERDAALAEAGKGLPELRHFAEVLGRHCATPWAPAGERTRPLIYRVGASAILLAAATRIGVDVEPFERLMEEVRAAEAARGKEP